MYYPILAVNTYSAQENSQGNYVIVLLTNPSSGTYPFLLSASSCGFANLDYQPFKRNMPLPPFFVVLISNITRLP